jgi:hypothetical protein
MIEYVKISLCSSNTGRNKDVCILDLQPIIIIRTTKEEKGTFNPQHFFYAEFQVRGFKSAEVFKSFELRSCAMDISIWYVAFNLFTHHSQL